MNKRFEIGDRVQLRMFDGGLEFPGTISDKLRSEALGTYVYNVLFDGEERCSGAPYTADQLEPYVEREPAVEWEWEFKSADGVVVAVLYEIMDGVRKELHRGHGHVLHEGVDGFVQASSYALKRIWDRQSGKEYRHG